MTPQDRVSSGPEGTYVLPPSKHNGSSITDGGGGIGDGDGRSNEAIFTPDPVEK